MSTVASQNELAVRKWWWLVAVTVVVGIAGAFVSLQIVKPEYQGTCRLFVAGRPDSGTGEGYQAAQFAQARVAAYLDLIKGARVAEGAINGLGLDMPTEDLQSRISATASAESVIISVSVVDMQAQRSADLANAVCLAFLAVAADAEGANPLVNTRIIEYANKPEYPVGPSRSRYLTVGALAGLLSGLALVMALGRVKRVGQAVNAEAPADLTSETQRSPTEPPPTEPPPPEDALVDRSDSVGTHRRRGV